MEQLRIAKIINESIVDGPGIRMTIFAQGCPHKCKGCHNPDTHDFSGGYLIDIDEVIKSAKKNPLLSGLTFSGGEPFSQAETFAKLAKMAHKNGLNIITYSGYTIEELLKSMNENAGWNDLLQEIDTLVDGRFILEQRDLTLKFRGSKNQRIIDPRQSILTGQAAEKTF